MEYEFGQKGWYWFKNKSEAKPCRFIDNITVYDESIGCIEGGTFSIEKPKRFNVGDVVSDGFSIFRFIGNSTYLCECVEDNRNIADEKYTLIYTAEQLDDPANYTVHKSKPQIEGFEFHEIRETEVHGEIHLRVNFSGQWRNIDNLGHFKRLAGFWYSENINALQNNSVMYDNEEAEDGGGFDNHLEKGGKVCTPKYVAFVKEEIEK